MKAGLLDGRWIVSGVVPVTTVLLVAGTALCATPVVYPLATPLQSSSSEASTRRVPDRDDVTFLPEQSRLSPDPRRTADYVGLSRAQSVHRLLATTRQTASTALPVWFWQLIPTPLKQRAWTPEEQAEANVHGERYQPADWR